MMNVGLGLTQYIRGQASQTLDGIGHYSHALYKQLAQEKSLNLLPFCFGDTVTTEGLYHDVKSFRPYGQHVIARSLIRRKKQMRLPGWSPDLVHATDHLTPMASDVPVVTTVMDAIPLSNPEWVSRRSYSVAELKFKAWKHFIRRSDKIIAPSEYSKQQIAEYFGIDEVYIHVVPLAVDERFFNMIDAQKRQKVLQQYNLNSRGFLLNVGTLQPRKNIKRLIQAMRLLPASVRADFPLVLVGRLGWSYKDDQEEILQAVDEGWCRWLMRVSDFDLRCLLQSAKSLIFPSLAEGFGLPVLEGFASKTPVITSDVSSMPEVAGDAALLVNPYMPEDIAEKIELVMSEKQADILVERGLKRSKQFTWLENARQTVNVYNSML